MTQHRLEILHNPLWRWRTLRNLDGEAYLRRFTIARLPGGRRIYLHKFIGDDWSRDPHDHPKAFLSVGLWGGYRELIYHPTEEAKAQPCLRVVDVANPQVRVWYALWVRRFPASHVHRLELLPDRRPCWTLVITGAVVKGWGFFPDGHFMRAGEYIDKVNAGIAADAGD